MNRIKFICPICVPQVEVAKLTEDAFNTAVAAHIEEHESKAALRAVDKARLTCTEMNCKIGKLTHFNKESGTIELTLTDFDLRFLAANKISKE